LPRSLGARERDVLDFLLAGDFPGARELREQARHAEVVGCCDCGGPTIDLAIDQARARPADVAYRVPVSAHAAGTRLFEILLLVDDDGWIESLEYVDHTGAPPDRMPRCSALGPPSACPRPPSATVERAEAAGGWNRGLACGPAPGFRN
jgi:hypothetical protein